MKKIARSPFCFGLLLTTIGALAQEEQDFITEEPVARYTIMERFEPELILTAAEREQMKAERFAEIKSKMEILDTLDISERKRDRLMEDLMEDPLSPRLTKTLAEIEFQENR